MDEDLKRLADKFGMDSSGRRVRRVTLEFVYDDEHEHDEDHDPDEDHELDEHVLSLFLMPPRGAAPAPDDPVE